MLRRHTRVRDREPLPPMLVGDDAAVGPAPADLVEPHERETAALLPDDLRVVSEGTSNIRLLLIAVALLAVFVLGLVWTEDIFNLDGQLLFVGGGCAVLAWLAHRDLVRRHREFRLTASGITVEMSSLVAGEPQVARVPWWELADYTVSVDYEKAYLRVVSSRGYTLTLEDRPPRLSTREFIRRFVEQADRRPRAAEPQPRRKGSPLPDVTGERPRAWGGFLTFLVLVNVSAAAETFLDLSRAQEMAGVAVLGTIAFVVATWMDLDDPEMMAKDAKSKWPTAWLRRWLRRVLDIHPS
jgi:hypothetical protein